MLRPKPTSSRHYLGFARGNKQGVLTRTFAISHRFYQSRSTAQHLLPFSRLESKHSLPSQNTSHGLLDSLELHDSTTLALHVVDQRRQSLKLLSTSSARAVVDVLLVSR